MRKANALVLPLSTIVAQQPASNQLTLSLSRQLGAAVEPPKPPRRMGAFSCLRASVDFVQNTSQPARWGNHSKHVTSDRVTRLTQASHIRQCDTVMLRSFMPLTQCSISKLTLNCLVAQFSTSKGLPYVLMSSCATNKTLGTIGYSHCVLSKTAAAINQFHAGSFIVQPVIQLAISSNAAYHGRQIAQYRSTRIQEAVPVPCRYFPIPEPPPLPPARVCRVRPPSHKLPFKLARRSTHAAHNLPLPLTCWHDTPRLPIPNKDTYLMHTVITATIAGIAVDPLSFTIKTDMNSYCWSGGIDISPQDYEKVKAKLNVAAGSEPILSVMVNNHRFSLIAEESGRSRSFANHTHHISGRSITARLGADYAKANDQMFDQASYASQLVNQQLQNTPVVVDSFGVTDWLIPANTYSVSNKTPIAVIAEVAAAAGGFVVSHDYDAKLSIKKRWKVNAWELATATPDVIIPADVIVRADDKPIKDSRYNVVTLIGNTEGYSVYRQTQGRDLPAPLQSNALYSSQDVTIPKGSAILSDSGKHNIYQLKLPWSHDVALAQLGQVWQVNDLDGSWRGVVTAVSISVELIDDAPAPFQTVTVDRYLDV